MMHAKQATWMFIIIISMSLSGWYFASPSIVVRLDKQTLSTTTDLIINDLTVHQFDANGKLVNYLQTPLMRHTPSKNTHWLKMPHIVAVQQKEAHWDIRSEEATSINNGQQITFNKNVIISQKEEKNNKESIFKTEEITYYPKEKLAMTKKEITYSESGNTIQATGMKAYLDEKRIQLLSQARGTYVSNDG